MSAARESDLTQPELVTELHAATAARREMGADMEDQVLEVFLARVQQRIDAQVAQQMARSSGSRPVKGAVEESPSRVMLASLAISIPLMGIAGGIANGVGIFMVMLGVVLINTLYFIDRWVRFNLK